MNNASADQMWGSDETSSWCELREGNILLIMSPDFGGSGSVPQKETVSDCTPFSAGIDANISPSLRQGTVIVKLRSAGGICEHIRFARVSTALWSPNDKESTILVQLRW